MTEMISISLEDARILYDLSVGGLGFGSGFFDTEDTECCRRLAVAIGLDPMEATPDEFTGTYKHVPAPVERRFRVGGRLSVTGAPVPLYETRTVCKKCNAPIDAWVHRPTVEPSRSEDGCGSLMCDGDCDVCLGLTNCTRQSSGGAQ
jgi:hypothetical protein